mgnify:CR=1 FL=1
MDREQFNKWAEYIKERDKYMAGLFRSGYDFWECRASLGRCLASKTINQPEAAIEILKTVVDVEVADGPGCDSSMTEIEAKAWAMQYLGVCVWKVSKDAQKALHYTDMALHLAESTNRRYCFISRGEIWSNRLFFLKQLNQMESALGEAQEKVALVQRGEVKSQSYAYYGYIFIARHEAEFGDLGQALQYLKQAFNYFPGEYWTLGEVEMVWRARAADMQGAFQQMTAIAERNWCWGDWWDEPTEVAESG